MSKIKVGQIYGHRHAGENIIIVVTKIKVNGIFYCIKNNGTVGCRWRSHFDNYDLIAEYPTWQEAVNSKEFNNG